jgi:hypothetical protein
MRMLMTTAIVAALVTSTGFPGGGDAVAAQAPVPPPSSAQGLDPLKPEPTPTEAVLGVPVFPTAQFLRSYDAGKGQRFYIFGAAASFAEVVAYYRTVLRQRGYDVFQMPPTHSFEVGRFREDSMAFPPGITVKDFTWTGSQGYPNPRAGAQPARYPTIIQIIPVPPQ